MITINRMQQDCHGWLYQNVASRAHVLWEQVLSMMESTSEWFRDLKVTKSLLGIEKTRRGYEEPSGDWKSTRASRVVREPCR